MALVVALANTGNQNGTPATFDVALGTSFAVGDVLVAFVACDNSGGGGAASMTSTSTLSGETVTNRRLNNHDPGAASAGTTMGVWTCVMTASKSGSETIRFNKATGDFIAVVLWKINSNTSGGRADYITVGGNAGADAATTTVTTASLTSGQAVIAATAYEGNTSITSDVDASNGSWSSQQAALANSGTTATSMQVASQYKVVTGTGTQTYNTAFTSASVQAAFVTFREIINATPTPATIAVTSAIDAATAKAGQTATPAVITTHARPPGTFGVASTLSSPLVPIGPVTSGMANGFAAFTGASTYWEALDDDPASPNTADYVYNPSGGSTPTIAVYLSWPTDSFHRMTGTLTVRAYVGRDANTLPQGLQVKICDANGNARTNVGTLLASANTVFADAVVTATLTLDATGLAATYEDWQDYGLFLQWTNAGGATVSQVRCYAARIDSGVAISVAQPANAQAVSPTDATATPAVIATTATMDAVAAKAGQTAFPATIAGPITMPAVAASQTILAQPASIFVDGAHAALGDISRRPTSDTSATALLYSTGTTAWSLIDDDPDSPDTADWVSNSTTQTCLLNVQVTSTALPADYGRVRTVRLRTYIEVVAATSLNALSVYMVSPSNAALTNSVLLESLILGYTNTNTPAAVYDTTLVLTAQGMAASAADWTGARLVLTWGGTGAAPAQIKLYAAELTYDYEPAGTFHTASVTDSVAPLVIAATTGVVDGGVPRKGTATTKTGLAAYSSVQIGASGTKLVYKSGSSGIRRTMSVAYDASTLSAAEVTVTIPNSAAALWFREDGTIQYWASSGSPDTVYQRSVTAWTPTASAATSSSSLASASLGTLVAGATSQGGSYLFVMDTTGRMGRWTMPTPYSFTSMTYDGAVVPGELTSLNPNQVSFSADGLTMFVSVGNGSVYVYRLASAWSLTRQWIGVISFSGSPARLDSSSDNYIVVNEGSTVSIYPLASGLATVAETVATTSIATAVTMDAVTAYGPGGAGGATAMPDTIVASVAMDASTVTAGQTASPATIIDTVTMDAVTASGTSAATPTPATITAVASMDAVTASGTSTATPQPATIAVPATMNAVTASGTSTATPTPATIVVPTAMDAVSASGASNATPQPATIITAATMNAVTASGTSTATPTPATIATVVTMNAATASGTSTATPAPATIATTVTMNAVTATGASNATPQPATIIVPTAMDAAALHAAGDRAPNTIITTVAMDAVTVKAGQTTTPNTIIVPTTMDAATTTATSTTAPNAIATTVTMDAAALTAGQTTTPDAIAAVVTMDATAATAEGNATAVPNTIIVRTAMNAVTAHAGATTFPAVIFVPVSMNAVAASGTSTATPTPATIFVPITMDAVTASGTSASTRSPATIATTTTMDAVTVKFANSVAPATIAAVATVNNPSASGSSASSAAPLTIATAVTMNAVTATGTSTATSAPASIAVVTSMNAPALQAGQTAAPNAIVTTAMMDAATLRVSTARNPTTIATTIAMGAVTASGTTAASPNPSSIFCTITMNNPTMQAGYTAFPATIAARVFMDTPVTFGGTLPTPADPLATTGYPGHRRTTGYLTMSASTSGYSGRRVAAGYDQADRSSTGYDGRRTAKGYQPV